MNPNAKKKYKKDETPSQIRKKLKKSEASKNRWKDKNREKSEESKIVKMRMKEARESRDYWREENLKRISENEILKEKLQRAEEELVLARITNMNLEEELREFKKKSQPEFNKLTDGAKTKRSSYTTYLKWLIVYIIIYTSAPFRTLEKILKIQMSCKMFSILKIPSDTSIRRWFNQVGYYKLTRSKKIADDWIYIIDNSVRAEERKVCLILGLRMQDLKQGKSVTFEDLEVLELRIINKNYEVEEILHDAIKKTSIPIQICSDEGSDIMPNIKRVIKQYPQIKHVPDIMHKTGNLLKKTLENDKRWKKFVTNVNKSNNTLKQSQLSFLCPPNFRGKSRFMNCRNVVDWADSVISILETTEKTSPHWAEMHKKLGWLLKCKKDIALFKELFHLADLGKEIIRKLHIEPASGKIAEELLKKAIVHKEGSAFAKSIIDFINQQCEKVLENNLMIGSSEIIESAFSKLKLLDRESGRSGFTHSIIGLAACFGNSDFISVEKAFTEHTYKSVLMWEKINLGETFQKKRKQIFKHKKRADLDLKIERDPEREKRVA